MSETPRATPRDELRAKIEASERRLAERTLADEARDATQAAGEYVKENPLKVIGGAVVLGIIIGAFTKPGRRAASNAASGATRIAKGAASGAVSGTTKTVTNAAKKRSAAFGTLLADAIVAYGIKLIDEALDGARAGQEALEDISDSAAAKAREVKRDAQYITGSATDSARAIGQRTRRRATRAVRKVADRVSG